MAEEGSRPTIGVVGEGAVARRARTRLEGAGYRVLPAEWKAWAGRMEPVGGKREEDPLGLCDIVLTFPLSAADARAYSGSDGIVARLRGGAILVIGGPVEPEVVVSIERDVQRAGIALVDAPMSADGGVIPVGVQGEELKRARPVLECLGRLLPVGEPGMAQQARLCQQIALMPAIIGLAEGLVYARAAGLDRAAILELLPGVDAGGGNAMVERGRRMLLGQAGDAETVGGLVADADAVLQQAESIDLDLPGLELARLLYGEIAEMGYADRGAESLIALWQDDEDPGGGLVQIGRR